MADMASNTITSGPYSRPYINHGSIVVGSPRGSGFLDSNYLLIQLGQTVKVQYKDILGSK